jgi:response regulator NasT
MDDVTRRPRILIVDDDQFTLTLVSALLEKNGYDVFQAKDGEDALNIMVLEELDMALLDINMPGMSGLELAKRLRADSELPFMFLSGVCDETAVKRAVEYGACGYLVKPVDVQNLIPTLEAGLARAADLKALRERESNLTSALAAGRETSIAVGILMERYALGRQQAFAAMRSHARSNRITINDVARTILDATESINQLRPAIEACITAQRSGSAGSNVVRTREERLVG